MQREFRDEVLRRIVQLCRTETRQALESGKLEFILEDTLKIQATVRKSDLPIIDRGVLALAVERLTPATHVKVQAPGVRPIELEIKAIEQDELSVSVEDRAILNRIVLLENRCRVAMESCKDFVVINDRDGYILDCNATRSNYGMDRLEMIGRHCSEVAPGLEDYVMGMIKQCFNQPEVPYYSRFARDIIPGLPCQFRNKSIVYGNECLSIVKNLTPYPWES